MAQGLLKVISNSIQRWPVIPEEQKNSLFYRIVRNTARRIYSTVFVLSPNRRKVNFTFWGGEGGFIHATAKFDLDDNGWKKTYQQFADDILKQIKPGMRILELGCSAGQWCKRLDLTQQNCTYTGVDINPKTIEFAKQKFAADNNVKFYAEDLIDFNKYDADLVIVCQTFFFLDRSTLLDVLKKIKPGTLLIMQEPVNDDYATQKTTHAMRYPLKNITGTGFSHNYLQMLREFDFIIIDEKIIERGKTDQKKLLVTARKN